MIFTWSFKRANEAVFNTALLLRGGNMTRIKRESSNHNAIAKRKENKNKERNVSEEGVFDSMLYF